VDYWLDVVDTLEATHPDPALELHLDASERAAADARWQDLGLGGQDVALLHPGSGAFSLARRWDPGRFAAVGDALAANGLRVGIVSGLGEEALAAEVQRGMQRESVTISGFEGPRELAALLRRARLFVGNDSGMMHCAAAMSVPVVGVFGLSNHRAWGPYPPNRHRVVRLDLPCSPCFYTGFGIGTPAGCPPRSCLTELGPEAVAEAARELLQTSVRTPIDRQYEGR
jgi:heptosyltransferase-2